MSKVQEVAPHRMLRRIIYLLCALVAILLAWLILCIYFFVLMPVPQATPGTKADAVVVLGGASKERLPRALSLMEQGAAPVLVLSHPNSPGNASADQLCDAGLPPQDGSTPPYSLECFSPDPVNTRGEASALGKLVAEHHWHSLIVVTSRYHEVRANLLIGQCLHAEDKNGAQAAAGTDAANAEPPVVSAAPSEPQLNLRGWLQRFVIESAGSLSALVHPECA